MKHKKPRLTNTSLVFGAVSLVVDGDGLGILHFSRGVKADPRGAGGATPPSVFSFRNICADSAPNLWRKSGDEGTMFGSRFLSGDPRPNRSSKKKEVSMKM